MNIIKNNIDKVVFVFVVVGILSTAITIVYDVVLFYDFVAFYAIISFGYLFYRYLFGVINYPLHVLKYNDINYTPSVSIILPCFNEETEILKRCIISACLNKYPHKEIIVINDGSTDKITWKTIRELRKTYNFEALTYEKNRGKRHAMALGFRKAKNEVIITMDSDSVITSDTAIFELVKPMIDRKIGAVSGCILVHNTNKTILTKMQDARYWLAFFLEKSSQSIYNGVTCASGPFSAYRGEYLNKYLDEWENQEFLGVKCTYGDDRGLTTFMLRNGYGIRFSRDAILYTDVPETLSKFIRQQIRWKKSFIRENWYLSKFIVEMNMLMCFEFIFFWIVFICGFITKTIIVLMLISGHLPWINFALMLLFVTFVHNIYMFIKVPGTRGYYGVLYGLFNEFIVSWLFFYSFITLKNSKWGTR